MSPLLRARSLHTDWTITAAPGPQVPEAVLAAGAIPAQVPGVVHTALQDAGLIDDPYLGVNERLQGWIGSTDWRYRTEFEWSPEAGFDRAELLFQGLDTVATVRLNGMEVLQSANQHRSYRVAVSHLLLAGTNELVVQFSAPVPYAAAQSLALGYRPHVNHHAYNAVRKMACSFGWDWGIDTSTSGIWRPVVLQEWATARLASVRPVAELDGGTGVLTVHADIDRADESPIEVIVEVAGLSERISVPAGAETVQVELRIPEVERWWPRGHGAPHRYPVRVELRSGETLLDVREQQVGFRTVDFDTEPDAEGTPFTIRINGEPVFVRGANWIPDDAFPHRVDRERYARRFDQAEYAGLNLIRVWGGGIYESEDFYDLADERGLLVWQDFLLACAAYAEEEPLRGEIEAEAREAVTRLSAHPSLILLNGNNENVWGYEEWNWQLRLEGRSWGAGYYYELFPSIVAELAPQLRYTPASPFSPDRAHAANAEGHGTMHIWDLWNQKDYPHYRDYRPRFVAEFGWQAPPSWSTLTESLQDDPLTPESPGMQVHQKAMEGNVKLTDGLIPHLPLPNDMADWHWAMQLNQADAISTAITWFRSLQPHCSGAIVWQLNDCWPVTSWAAVDGYGRPKPLLYALRNANAERLLTFQPQPDGALAAVLVNDTAEPWSGTLALRRFGYDGRELDADEQPVTVAARGALTVAVPTELASPGDAGSELLRGDLDGTKGHWFFTEYRDSALPQPADGSPVLDAAATPVDGGYQVRVRATGLLRALSLLPDKVHPEAVADEALLTLLPGETVVFFVRGPAGLDPDAFLAPEVLRSANQLMPKAGALR